MLSKSLIQFSADGWNCSLPAIYLGPNCGGGNEDNGYLLQTIPCMYCYTQCPQPCSNPAAGLVALRVVVLAWDLLKEVAIVFITPIIVWPQVKQQGGNTAPTIKRKLD